MAILKYHTKFSSSLLIIITCRLSENMHPENIENATIRTQQVVKKSQITPSLYCRNRLLVSFLSKFCRYRSRNASTVSTWVLCFTASSRALKSQQNVDITRTLHFQIMTDVTTRHYSKRSYSHKAPHMYIYLYRTVFVIHVGVGVHVL